MIWILLALLSGSCAAVLAVMVKLHLKHVNPLFLFLLFSLVSIVELFIVDLLTNRVEIKLMASLAGKDWIMLLIAGTLHSFAFVCYLTALKFGPTGGVIALDRLGIVFAIVLAVIFLQEAITAKAIIGSIMMILGAFLIAA